MWKCNKLNYNLKKKIYICQPYNGKVSKFLVLKLSRSLKIKSKIRNARCSLKLLNLIIISIDIK